MQSDASALPDSKASLLLGWVRKYTSAAPAAGPVFGSLLLKPAALDVLAGFATSLQLHCSMVTCSASLFLQAQAPEFCLFTVLTIGRQWVALNAAIHIWC